MDAIIESPTIDPANGPLVESILRALPEWFGIEDAIIHYRDFAAAHPTLIAKVAGAPVGCLAIMQHSPFAAEVYVMGVLPEFHGQGIGRMLVQSAEGWLIEQGVEYLQVKTLADTHPDPGYAKTRLFYEKMGFRPLEVFPTLWGEANPCLVMVKRVPG